MSEISDDGLGSMYLLNLDAGFAYQFGSTTRSKQPNIIIDQAFSKIKKAGLVEDT